VALLSSGEHEMKGSPLSRTCGHRNGGGMEVQGTDAGMIGPGGEFVFSGGGSDWLVYHYYDAFDNGDAWIQVRPLTWIGGWPVTGQALVPVPGQPGPPAS
jgi:hypothetical protein